MGAGLMPMAPPRPCRTPGCPALVARGAYCITHRRAEYKRQNQRKGSSSAQGYGAAWRRLRLAVLADEPLCRMCWAGHRVKQATQVDHIVPREWGGTDDRANLQPLCTSHHSAKTARESAFGRNEAHTKERVG